MYKELLKLSDKELVILIKDGNVDAVNVLHERYHLYVKAITSKLFAPGADQDDMAQEGMIAFIKSIDSYDVESKVLFKTYAITCVKNHLSSYITHSLRKKHRPLNSSISINDKEYENGIIEIEATYIDQQNPESLYIGKELQEDFSFKIQEVLSNKEKEVLIMHLSGMNYKEIAQKLNESNKSIDNCIQRIKSKAKKILKEHRA